ncbi:hypothetical protein ACWGII_18760 [Streptomyces sp. NPDC054855]
MSSSTIETRPEPPAGADVLPDAEWDLGFTFTRSPLPIPAACDTSDGCAKTCDSSCSSS